ncbi:Cytosolic purine 5'-nucleotidase [Taenia crassiceps]|uniref:Cytosolic purine 5'-nucleotidase n=1 Tax=Taenia crassiceps TaxID=6207 RepID=A0ABR4QTS7_9CEST
MQRSLTNDDLDAQFLYGTLHRGRYQRRTKNRSLRLDRIRFFGFDMDYTLACKLSTELIEFGYPQELSQFEYEPSFPVRGLWFDQQYGTLMKIDQFGNILMCLVGFNVLSRLVYLILASFLLEIYLLACIIHYMHNNDAYIKEPNGVKYQSLYISYKSILQDVEEAMSWMHMGELKKQTMANIGKYIEQNPKLLVLLDKLRTERTNVFLLTNSDYEYSDAVMKYLCNLPDKDGNVRHWTSYFDYIVVDAKKPVFFQEGTLMRAVDMSTGRYKMGQIAGPLERSKIYAGGSSATFTHLIGAQGKDVLYTGDHIFGDILKSKRQVGWKTFLVVPELLNEIYVWKKKNSLFERLNELDNELADKYKDLNIASNSKPDVSKLHKEIRTVANEMNEAYGLLGSIFRHGSRLTTFSSQAMQFADLYSYSCYNLIYYPLCYMFRAPPMLMPHESTVPHEETAFESFKDLEDSPCGLRRRTTTEAEMAQHIKAMLLKRLPDSMMATHSSAGEAEVEDERGKDDGIAPVATMTTATPDALKNTSSHMETVDISGITSSSSSSSQSFRL